MLFKKKSKPIESDFTSGAEANIDAFTNHIEKYIGTPDRVYHQIVSDRVHIDIHVVKATDSKPFHTLVTTGMSDREMSVPKNHESLRYAELCLSLPKEWPLEKDALNDEKHYWPIRWLQILATLPFENNTWLGLGHTIGNGEPPAPFADNTKLCAVLIGMPLLHNQEFWEFSLNKKKTINFYSIIPIYKEELELKNMAGFDGLIDQFERYNINELLDINRINTCTNR